MRFDTVLTDLDSGNMHVLYFISFAETTLGITSALVPAPLLHTPLLCLITWEGEFLEEKAVSVKTG